MGLWENFIESLTAILARSLSNSETEAIVQSFQAFQQRLRDLSHANLKKLQEEERDKSAFCKHYGKCTTNCLAALVRSFGISYTLKYLLGFVPALITGKLYRNPSLFYKFGGKDTFSFAVFMAIFISGYKGILCYMRHIRQKQDFINAFIAGSISGLSILFDSNKTRRIMIALCIIINS